MITFENCHFTYSDQKMAGVFDLNFTINEGEVILFCGASGCGKTTIIRLINGLIPHYFEGDLKGNILVDNTKVADLPLYQTAGKIGSVFQNPKSQFFSINTTEELAFCCENLGVPKNETLSRIQHVSNKMQLSNLLNRNIFHLSGGEKQKIACAAVSIAEPTIYVLDEPSSNIDRQAIEGLKRNIAEWKQQGKIVVLAEHRLHYLKDLVDRIFYMHQGKIVQELTRDELLQLSYLETEEMGLRPLSLSRLEEIEPKVLIKEREQLYVKNYFFSYTKNTQVLDIPELELSKGTITAIIGKNGAGKTTFLRCLSGLEKDFKSDQKQGKLLRKEKKEQQAFMVMQDVNYQLFCETVRDEVLISMREPEKDRAEKLLQKLELSSLAERHPLSLSGGQKQRLAIACALASERSILAFDEPTSGLDLISMKKVAVLLKKVKQKNSTILIVTHDPEFILHCCDSVIEMNQGQITEKYPLNSAGKEKILCFFTEDEDS